MLRICAASRCARPGSLSKPPFHQLQVGKGHMMFHKYFLFVGAFESTTIWLLGLTHPKSLGWRFLKIYFFNDFDTFSDMICCYDLFMAWFCCYDFDMVSVMILIWFQLWFLMWVQTCDLKPTHRNHIQNIPKSYQNHIKTVSKSYQKRIKIISKPQKPSTNRPKTCPCAVSVSFSEANSLEPYQNHIKIVSKSYQNHIKIIPKP